MKRFYIWFRRLFNRPCIAWIGKEYTEYTYLCPVTGEKYTKITKVL